MKIHGGSARNAATSATQSSATMRPALDQRRSSGASPGGSSVRRSSTSVATTGRSKSSASRVAPRRGQRASTVRDQDAASAPLRRMPCAASAHT
ncbi:hypothetical protein F511_47524 [Dorcoceras hygrometricum]|uniref:Uncharacterized protein n=1 Tax=Dorcoceras hygrometricum TaxID=472368 RepID=A0A2Z6ZRS8_9LAMI|nr:hypothetical protein F511_47524 [Dorcoceras hygrometricum]